ncbi:MAG: hypothetical protein IH596_09125 [Bacteroidales bacterium]|nr:hypothetical protein [Bacteroidales bacterium]
MLIYRFKVTSEEHEEFVREICIQPGQKFIDFYQCILESAELIPADQASFYLTDKKYKKDREISLNRLEKQVRRYDPEMDEMMTIAIVPKLMKDAKLKDYIEDPHQRMIFEYHGREYFTFFVELLKIMHSDEEGLYPKCVKWVGELPKKLAPIVAEVVEEEKPLITELLKKVIPDLDSLTKLDGIEEDEAELASIEDNLVDILLGDEEKDAPEPLPGPKLHKKTLAVQDEPDDIFGDEDHEDEDDKEDFSDGMDHLEDYDNIENIEIKYSKYHDDTDDD